jgi:hypothetical protein
MIPKIVLNLVLAVAVLLPVAQAQVYQPQERFLGMVSDGARLKADKILNWFDQTSNPTLGGHALFDVKRPLRWMIDQAVELGPAPDAMLEFFGGDRLPARVIEYIPSAPESFENLGEFLIVKPTVSVDLPNQPPSDYIRVSMQWLRRVVFDRRSGTETRYEPGTVFLRDGSRLKFKVVRWGNGTLSVLTSKGIQTLVLAQVAELHLPARNAWDVWFEQLAAIDPLLDQRLFQIESSDGVRLTTSRQRLRPLYVGDHNKSENWFPEFQPAWSFDPLVLPFKTIRHWRFFSAIEPPASIFEPHAEREGVVFSAGWNWQRNQNVQNTNLINNALHYGWGFGVHAPTTLSLSLHPVVSHFRSRIGLDQVVTVGGCARGIIAIESKAVAELQRSPILIGNQALHDTNWLTVTVPAEGESALVLTADPVIVDRPAKADPFDIRDCLNWLEPEWRLDKAKLQTQVSLRIPQVIPSFVGWTLENRLLPIAAKSKDPKPAAQPTLAVPMISAVVYRDDTIAEDLRTRIAFQPIERFVVLKRSFKLDRKAQWFVVAVSRVKGSTPAWVQVRANGRAIGQGDVSERTSRLDPDPVMVPVAHLAGKEVEFEIVMIAEGEKSQLEFRGARVLSHRPGLVQILEDDDDILKRVNNGEGEITMTQTMPYKGSSALKLTGGDRFQARIKDFTHTIAEHPRLGEYRYLRFAWKKEGGQKIGLQLAYNGQIGPPVVVDDPRKNLAVTPAVAARKRIARERAQKRKNGSRGARERLASDARGIQFGYQYDTGNDKSPEPVMRLDRKPPTAWVINGRDLFGEFGAFDLTGLGFRCPDGDAAYFDHIYLARTQNDFQFITDGLTPAAPNDDKNVLVNATRAWEHQIQVQTFAPQFTLARSGEPVQMLKEWEGKKNVVRTTPEAQGKPGIFRAPISVPPGKKTVLKIDVGRNVVEKADWQLIVKVGAETLHSSMVDPTTAKDGWVTHELDLSKFAGKNIVVEVHNHPNNWHYEHAFWRQLAIESN